MATEQILQIQAESIKRGALSIWTIYDKPRDFPHSYVARRFEVSNASTEPLATDDVVQGDLPIIRKSFAQCGLTCIPRDPSDEPQIVESWL